LFFEFPHRRPSLGDWRRRTRCKKPEGEGSPEQERPRLERIETLRGRGAGRSVVLATAGGLVVAKARERRLREAGANVGARRPQEVESQGRIGRSFLVLRGWGEPRPDSP
jgi:hypothetical protein